MENSGGLGLMKEGTLDNLMESPFFAEKYCRFTKKATDSSRPLTVNRPY